MDEAGIDIQVLSHGAPSAQKLTGSDAAALTARVNDRLAAFVKAKPDRFAAFAALATCDPVAAANELERTVTKYGFKGAMVHGLTGGLFLDDKRFWPIFERAERLDVPIYLHPSVPHPAVMDAYYKDYVKEFPMGSARLGLRSRPRRRRSAWCRRVRQAPDLKIGLGHLGERCRSWSSASISRYRGRV